MIEATRRSRSLQGEQREQEKPDLELWRGSDGQLWAHAAERRVAVRVARCFPWSEPGRHLSLRDADDDEVAWVTDIALLTPASRRALALSLLEVGFVFEVEAVTQVEEEIEIRFFRVRTRQGWRSFQTHRDEWPREMPGGALLIRDVVGDLYYVRAPEELDPKSRKLLWAFMD